jgi:two-component system, OmpR family, alkaline phosphatase synthesis response regulator PhoP
MELHKILLVDDEPDILEFLGYNLKKEGYNVLTATNGIDAIEIAKKEKPDLIILDVMMPEMDGMEVCKELRKISSLKNVMITFLTARNEEYSQISGFDSGSDDYITKPIKPTVFVSRVKDIVEKDGKEIIFPKKEFELLNLLISKPGKVFKREEILNSVWGGDVVVGDRTIDVHIRKLREKIGNDYFKTIKGVGYKFDF